MMLTEFLDSRMKMTEFLDTRNRIGQDRDIVLADWFKKVKITCYCLSVYL